jgi:antitoxin VapB
MAMRHSGRRVEIIVSFHHTHGEEEFKMALNIKNSRTEALAQQLARETGESLTQAVTTALADRLAALQRRKRATGSAAAVARIQAAVAAMPDRDTRSAEDILGYDAHGLPG